MGNADEAFLPVQREDRRFHHDARVHLSAHEAAAAVDAAAAAVAAAAAAVLPAVSAGSAFARQSRAHCRHWTPTLPRPRELPQLKVLVMSRAYTHCCAWLRVLLATHRLQAEATRAGTHQHAATTQVWNRNSSKLASTAG
eukprot:2358983-Pleurochrysis_carterae.AAC.2